MKCESQFHGPLTPCLILALVMTASNLAAGQDQGKSGSRRQEQPTTQEQILGQYRPQQTTPTDADKLLDALKESKAQGQANGINNQNIWNQTVFGVPCKESTCQDLVTGKPTSNDANQQSHQPAPSPCSIQGMCNPQVGNGDGQGTTPLTNPCSNTKGHCGPTVGGGGGPGPTPPPSPCSNTKGKCPPSVGGGGQGPTPVTNPCGSKSGCPPSVGGGGQGPKPPVNPCASTNTCGPSVGGDGGVYNGKTLQKTLHPSDQLKQLQNEIKTGEAQNPK